MTTKDGDIHHNEELNIYFGCIKRRKNWKQMPDRKICCSKPDLEVPNNRISTSKYTLITFFPKNLLEQFSRAANIYFLVKMIFDLFVKKSLRLWEYYKFCRI